MKKIYLKKGEEKVAPVTTENSIEANIDATYTKLTYSGDKLAISMNHDCGIKTWSNTITQYQGMAIYGDILIRMANVSKSTTHYIYRIASSGAVSQVASFSCSTSGHSNSIQFAPTVESGNAYPYFYVDYLDGKCTVFSMSDQFAVTQVQTITTSGLSMSFLHIGDDGNIWGVGRPNGHWRFVKFRKVAVSEGANVELTTSDVLEDWTVAENFPTADYTAQGWKVKFGKVWLILGTTGDGQKRALVAYDIASKRLSANIDLTNFGNIEYEDIDFWDDAAILCTYSAVSYIMRF